MARHGNPVNGGVGDVEVDMVGLREMRRVVFILCLLVVAICLKWQIKRVVAKLGGRARWQHCM
jgi:hypothetical protein